MASTGRDVDGRAWARRRGIRFLAGALAGAVAVLYAIVFFVQLPHLHETDNPAPLYAFLAVVYAVGAGLVVLRDAPLLHGVGAVLQLFLIAGFFWLLGELYRHGEESFILDMLGLAIAITAIQVVLLGLLTFLAVRLRPTLPG